MVMTPYVIAFLKFYFIFTVIVMILFAIRHFIFTFNRMYCEQKLYYQDIIDSDLPFITVLIPMHNEEKVAHGVLDALLESNYPVEKFEVIPINDFSEDGTKEILEDYAVRYGNIHPLHRNSGERGKPAALNRAMEMAQGEIIVVFDADYLPGKGLLENLSTAFLDPEVGAVMGRVVPVNTKANFLTRLLDLERSGGYQVDQQARYNLNLIPQYGGTVGGYRKDLMMGTDGFNTKILAEDTELTYRLFCSGWKVLYANSAECYEEAPEAWHIRARQIARWSRGHNEVMFCYVWKLVKSKYLSFWQKLDGMFLLFIYMMPVILFFGLIDSILLFFLDEMDILEGWWVLLFLGAYNTFGNFAPFYQVGTANVIDGSRERILLLPYLAFNFYFYLWFITKGFFNALVDVLTRREAKWQKTERFRKEKPGGFT